jgi:hypothetical protein
MISRSIARRSMWKRKIGENENNIAAEFAIS